jgi:trigger factor
MSVVVSIEDVGACQKRVKVAVPAPAVAAETERIAGEYRRKARIPGFRAGKVPTELVKKRYAEEIERELLERVVPRYWKQAEAETGLDPLLPPEVEDVERKAGEDLVFVATVDLRPEIELGDLEGFDLPDPPVEPGDREVDEALEGLRRSMGVWVDVDRPAVRGDLVVGSVREIGAEAGQASGSPATFEVGDPQVWEELTIAATGLAAGQREEFERRPAAAPDTGSRKYALEVEKVRERELAPLDDEFAGKVGDFEGVAALRSALSDRLRRSKERDRRIQRETALLDQLCARHPIELPKRVVDHEIEQLLREYAATLGSQGVDLDRAKIDWSRLAQEARPRAERRVRARLLLDEVAVRRGVDVEQEEIEQALSNMAAAQRTTSGALRRDLDQSGRLGELREQLKREKTLRLLLGDEPADGGGAGEVGAEEPARDDDVATD